MHEITFKLFPFQVEIIRDLLISELESDEALRDREYYGRINEILDTIEKATFPC